MFGLIVTIVLVLGVIAIAQLARVFELTKQLKGTREEDISHRDNKMNATLFLLCLPALFGFYIWLVLTYGEFTLPGAASVHGLDYDALLSANWWVVNFVFVVCHLALFGFAYKYYQKDGQRAEYLTHSNKLEMWWTIVPAVVMAVIIIFGLRNWNAAMADAPEEAMRMELYAKQFDWTARYAGADDILGEADFRLIDGANFMGLDSADTKGHDDKIVKGEFHLPINKSVEFLFRSQDVIHSAYMPHFRVQMNTVPGMRTKFHMTPNKTTAQMREELGNPDFDFILLCNKICGASHYNMQMKIVIDTQEDYDKWLADQGEFLASDSKETTPKNLAIK